MKETLYFKFHISERPSMMYAVQGNLYMSVLNYEDHVEIDTDKNSNTTKRIKADKYLKPVTKGEFLLFLSEARAIQDKRVF